ncbi:hypothetical protein ACVWYH_007206 [Bradyrhizobium sp. GM24.11]
MESSSSQELKNLPQRLNGHVTVKANTTAAAKLNLDEFQPLHVAQAVKTPMVRRSRSEPLKV